MYANNVNISGGGIADGSSSAAVRDNTVTINVTGYDDKAQDNWFSTISGGSSSSGITAHNRVELIDGLVKTDVYGGMSDNGNAEGNEVDIKGGTVLGKVYGGCSANGTANATGNRVTITGGTIGDESTAATYVAGGESSTAGNATDNIVTLQNATINGHVYGGKVFDGTGMQPITTVVSCNYHIFFVSSMSTGYWRAS